MDMHSHKRQAAIALAVLTVLACDSPNSQQKQEFSDSLIVAPRSYETQFKKLHGTGQISYKLDAAYPAASVLSLVSEELQQKGWRPLNEDFLNPGIPTSHVRGWTQFHDATKRPEQIVHQWAAGWGNHSGDIVTYFLEYRYPKDGQPDLIHLQVLGFYAPAKIAKEMKADAERFRRVKKP